MDRKWVVLRILLVVGVVFLVQLACTPFGPTNDVNTSSGVDLAGTEQALKQTQAALEAAAQQQAVPSDTPEPPPPAGPTITPEPPPPTFTPEPIPLPKLDAYPEGTTVYFTDFDSTGDIEPGWFDFGIPSTLRYDISMTGGYIRVKVPDQNSAAYLIYEDMYFGRDFADVYVEARFQNKATHNINNISVICRATDKGWYEFSMLSGGLWYIWLYDTESGYRKIKDGGIPNLNYDAPHTIGAECRGNYLTFYFDGKPLKNGSITNSQFDEGMTGIAVYAADWENVIVEFDYFAIAVP